MNAIILAAGQGSRLRPLTAKLPKCLLAVKGMPLLDYQIEALFSHGIERVIIITGFEGDQIKKHCEKKKNVITIPNPIYETTEAVYSLLMAKEHMGEEVIILDGDMLFHPEMLELLLRATKSSVLVDFQREKKEEDLKVISKNGVITDMAKDIDGNGIWVSLAFFKGSFLEEFKKLLTEKKYWNKWWSIPIREHLLPHDLQAIDIERLPWVEIDTIEDLNYAEAVVHPQIMGRERNV